MLLGLSGSVASIKAVPLVEALSKFAEVCQRERVSSVCERRRAACQVKLCVTDRASGFITKDSKALEGKIYTDEKKGGKSLEGKVYTDDNEWNAWHKLGDPVIHIEVSEVCYARADSLCAAQLRSWADIFVIAPLSANTLGGCMRVCGDESLCNSQASWRTVWRTICWLVSVLPAPFCLLTLSPTCSRLALRVRGTSGGRSWSPRQ